MNKPSFSFQWHITTMCEQRCKHCYLFNAESASSEIYGEKLISNKTLISIADNIIETCQKIGATPRVSITGGNPVLHPYFWSLLGYLKQQKVRVSLMGNPYDITDAIAKRFTENNVSKFQLSLDGLETTHDSLRQNNSYSSTVNACKILSRNGIDVAIMATVSRTNMEEMPELVKKVVGMKARAFAFARFCPSNNDKSASPSPIEYRRFLERMWEVFTELKGRGTSFILKDHLWNLYLSEIGEFKPVDTGGIVVDGCGIGISHMTILADGSVYACRRFKSPIGKVPEQSLYDIFFSKEMEQYREIDRLEKCKNCILLNYCRGCMAVSQTVTGNWTAPDPQCWR